MITTLADYGRSKGVCYVCSEITEAFAMICLPGEDDFMCSACASTTLRVVEAIGQSIANLTKPLDWSAVRHIRNIKLSGSDNYEIPAIRRRVGTQKTQAWDVYRQWLRDITDAGVSPSQAMKQLLESEIP